MAQEGIGRRAPLCSECNPPTASLDAERHQAVEHILQSRDFVTLFRGGAGTGKSFTLLEVHKALRRDNRPVEVLAPQRQQVADLETDGFAGAQTASAFLARRSLPRGAVVLVDEAGQIGGEQMLELLRHVKENDRTIHNGLAPQRLFRDYFPPFFCFLPRPALIKLHHAVYQIRAFPGGP